VFSQSLDLIWADLSTSDLQNGSLQNPLAADLVLSEVNQRIRSNRQEQNTYLRLMQPNLSKGDANGGGKGFKKSSLAPEIKISTSDYILNKIMAYSEVILGEFNIPRDDGIRSMSADDYLKLRLIPMAAHYMNKAPGLALTSQVALIMGVLLAVSSSIISTFGFSVYIPAVLAFSSTISGWTNYQQVELRLLQTNAAQSQLNQLLVWWDGLSMIEKRVPSNKDRLITESENVILSQATIYSGSNSSNSADRDGDGDIDSDDEDTSGKDKKDKK